MYESFHTLCRVTTKSTAILFSIDACCMNGRKKTPPICELDLLAWRNHCGMERWLLASIEQCTVLALSYRTCHIGWTPRLFYSFRLKHDITAEVSIQNICNLILNLGQSQGVNRINKCFHMRPPLYDCAHKPTSLTFMACLWL